MQILLASTEKFIITGLEVIINYLFHNLFYTELCTGRFQKGFEQKNGTTNVIPAILLSPTDQICQKVPCMHTISMLTFHHHLMDTTID